ncbi:exopolysaccharide Pel transporter PelG [Paenibacillus sp. LHD-117]|uniref:exopolysaccharide Pel transporter PelG n=1 Tax=Paenibacillus sp. LHD-117 TaxID=3071412 RepID=UPI0027E1F01E|nr:exopolysaccharide Pel transporter PelG [Paenibacillus sp. LHD-117]MDQ6420724.1 exopolysaccharide Pel transporter PelG [Paenibacillus sp. LHD-117]
MAGIGFELRKLFREQGLINNVKAYAYSSLTTVGPMILCMFLIMALQRIMSSNEENSYIEWELYIATVSYCFVFSIVFTSGISMVLTRYVADMIFGKKYERLMSSFYGALVVMLPIGAVIATVFLSGVEAGLLYKSAAYLFFMELVVIWIQSVYLSALKDYMRIVRSYIIGVAIALLSGWLLFQYTELQPTTAALAGIDIGFLVIVMLSFHHFRHMFPKADAKRFFEYMSYFKKYRSLFFAGSFVYSGVYLHNFVYWLGPRGVEVAERYLVMPFYDLPVFYAFLSVMPTLVTFVVSVETSFYVKLRLYYLNILNNGTIQDIQAAKKTMQKTLVREISFMMEVQLLFTVLAIALGIKFLPMIGFTMAQLEVFYMLALGYFLFIILFVLVHILMYFDDRKGVVAIGGLFVVLNIGLSYWMMNLGYDGLGMFMASFISLAAVIARLLYVLRNIDYYTFCAQPIHVKEQVKRTRGKSFLTKPGTTVSIVLILAVTLSACSSTPDESAPETAPVSPSVMSSSKLVEDKRLYDRDVDASLKALYITVLPDKSDEPNALTWYGLNRLPDRTDEGELDIIVQEGSEDGAGPVSGKFGYGASQANGSITLRGRTAWYTSQKSYRIKLFDEAGLWLDQRSFNLNKHSLDLSRIRNKLSFDLLEDVDNITSLRTQFMRVFVKDLSEGQKQATFVDYGLYTHVEQPNKKFLQSHMLDPNAHLYKVAFFEYGRYENVIKSQNDPTYDKAAFETILEIKGREEHEKLIRMLDDVNNNKLSIDDVVEKHFDKENFLTWTAVNILMDNMDTDANNFYLYSPLNSEKWYILPWDYDGGWEMQRNMGLIRPHQSGLSNFWGSVLHNRYFREPDHVEELKEKLEELSTVINKQRISELLDSYVPIVKPYLYRSPDIEYLPGLNSGFEAELEVIKNTPERGLRRFMVDLEKPKPFYQDDVVQEKGKLQFSWGLSFDLQGDDLIYDVEVAKDPLFAKVVASRKGVKENRIEIAVLDKGTYYWKVRVRDGKGNEQYSFDYYQDTEGTYYNGMREFEVQ